MFLYSDTATPEIYTLSLHDALPISIRSQRSPGAFGGERKQLALIARHALTAVLPFIEHGTDFCAMRAQRIFLLGARPFRQRSEEHTSELQSQFHLVCRLLLEKKNNA